MLHTAPVSSVSAAPAAPTHHLDHLELLMLDGAIVRLTDRYLGSRTLSADQRAVLEEYHHDVVQLSASLSGPAREYADQLATLAATVLGTPAAGRRAKSSRRSAAA
jgi:hypothetical protein